MFSLINIIKFKILLVAVGATIAYFSVTKGLDFYSLKKLEDEGLSLREAGLYEQATERFARALAKWGPEKDKYRIKEELSQTKEVLEAKQKASEKIEDDKSYWKQTSEGNQPDVLGVMADAQNDGFTTGDTTKTLSATPTPTPTTTPIPTPTNTPTPTPTPTAVPINISSSLNQQNQHEDPTKVLTLGDIALRIAQINQRLNTMSGELASFQSEKQKCLDSPNYNPSKIGIENQSSLVSLCLSQNQQMIDTLNVEIGRLGSSRTDLYQQKDLVMMNCSFCQSAWDSIVGDLIAKGWPM